MPVKGHAHAAREKRIFAVGLLPAAPAGVAEDVDVGRPEVEAFKDIAVACAHGLHMLDAAFCADDDGHGMNGLRIEGSAEADGLRELRCAVCSAAVERLAPPIVRRNVEMR